MAVKVISVTGLLCEKVLQEDKIFSAIRIVDVFGVPPDPPANSVVQFTGLVIVKAMPTDEDFKVTVAIIGSSGERVPLPDPPGSPFKFAVFEGDPSIPVGFSLVLQFNVGTGKMGTNYIEVEIDGVTVIRMPFTLRRLPAEPVV